MSKVKDPQEKKSLSLSHDRRNMYGESPHSSRKNISLGKQRQHQEERRAANQVLSAVGDASDYDSAVRAEIASVAVAQTNRLKGFKKQPDKPLAESIARKHSRRGKIAAGAGT